MKNKIIFLAIFLIFIFANFVYAGTTSYGIWQKVIGLTGKYINISKITSNNQADKTTSENSIIFGGLERTYLIHIPYSYDKKKSVPLVIMLHGGEGDAESMVNITKGGFNSLSDKEGFIVVYPNGIKKHWNDFRNDTEFVEVEKTDDVGFISALIDHLVKTKNIDSKNVYVAGISNGGMMAHRLALELVDKITAVATIAGNIPEDQLQSAIILKKAIPVLIISGTGDPIMPWGGGYVNKQQKRGKVISVFKTLKYWVNHSQYSSTPTITWEPNIDLRDGTRVQKEVYKNGKNETEVILYTIEGGGHTWPGGYQYLPEKIIGKTSKDIDANEVIWNFFKKHRIVKCPSLVPPSPDSCKEGKWVTKKTSEGCSIFKCLGENGDQEEIICAKEGKKVNRNPLIGLVNQKCCSSLYELRVSKSYSVCQKEKSSVEKIQSSEGIPNPASVYCLKQDGKLEIRKTVTGDEYGVCVFLNTSECEEWAFFRGECKKNSISEPKPAKSDYLIGAYYFPGWKQGTFRNGWEAIKPFPERKPSLGWYQEGEPEVADWHIRWAVEHGISFFIYDWYWDPKLNKPTLTHALHDGYFNSKYRKNLKFSILWANDVYGNSTEKVLMDATKFWLDNYFNQPEYFKIDNKPVITIYNPVRFANDLGSVEEMKTVFEKMEKMVKEKGFDGLYLIGCAYPGEDKIKKMKEVGYDAVTGYNYPYAGQLPEDGERFSYDSAIKGYEKIWNEIADYKILSYIAVTDPGYDARPWLGEKSLVRTFKHPDKFEQMLKLAKKFADKNPIGYDKKKIVLVEAWNEFGEGDVIEPHQEFGFGYLDVIRKIFTSEPKEHIDLIPQELPPQWK